MCLPLKLGGLTLRLAASVKSASLNDAFALARFSEAFLVLRAQQGGLALAWTPLVLIAMNLVYALGAYPFGLLADRMSHRRLLGAEIGRAHV